MANELVYGDRIYLLNGYDGWQGGYLDTIHHSAAGGAKYGVETAETPTRGAGTGTWEILSPSGKAVGATVSSGDLIYLFNLYGGDGGYLDANGPADSAQKSDGGMYDVTTSQTVDRYPGTGRWRIFARTSSPGDQAIRIDDVVLLWNTYAENGGFLETNGLSTVGDKLNVCTNAYFNRSANVADWRVHRAS